MKRLPIISLLILIAAGSISYAGYTPDVGKWLNQIRLVLVDHPNKFAGDRNEWQAPYLPHIDKECVFQVRNKQSDSIMIPLHSVKDNVEVSLESPANGGDKGAMGACFVCEGPSHPISKQTRCIGRLYASNHYSPIYEHHACFSFGKLSEKDRKKVAENFNKAIRTCRIPAR